MTKLRHPKSQPGIPAQQSLQANLHKSAGNKSHKSRADSRKGAEANLAKHWQYWRLNMEMIGQDSALEQGPEAASLQLSPACPRSADV